LRNPGPPGLCVPEAAAPPPEPFAILQKLLVIDYSKLCQCALFQNTADGIPKLPAQPEFLGEYTPLFVPSPTNRVGKLEHGLAHDVFCPAILDLQFRGKVDQEID